MHKKEDSCPNIRFSDEKQPLEQCFDPKVNFQKKVIQRLTERKNYLKKMLKAEPPSFLIDSDEKTLRNYVGKHRIIPKKLRTDLVLERAFRKRNVPREDSLFNLFEKEFIQKGENIYEYLYDGIDIDSPKSDLDIEPETHEKEYSYTMLQRYSSMGHKIAVLETVKKIFSEIADEKHNQISSTPQIAEELNVERSEHSEEKEINFARTRSFERFRSNILHDMYIERRPLSWFKKRCKYFQGKIKKKPQEPLTVQSEPIVELPREVKVNEIIKEAVYELLALQRSNIYDNYQFPEDILLEKFIMIMKKANNSLKRVKDAEFKSTERLLDPIVSTSSIDDSESKNTNCSENVCLVEETIQPNRLFSKDIEDEVWNLVKKMLEFVENKKFEDSNYSNMKGFFKKIINLGKIENNAVFTNYILNEYQDELEENCKLEKPLKFADLNEQREYFHTLYRELLQMIFGEEVFTRIFPEINLEEKESPRKEVVFPEFLGWDENVENLLLSHVKKGEEVEDEKINFETVWKDSILTGLCLINNEVQFLEEGRIIIRAQKDKRVRIMSGGRVGLEPLYAEYVAQGMLDCVVLGDKQSGPSTNTILRAIAHMPSEDGIAIIIMNEFQYRFNFVLAATRAKYLHCEVCVLLCKDDVSNLQEGCQNLRSGSAGIIIQFKIASAMAQEGHSLKSIRRIFNLLYILSLSCYVEGNSICIGNGLKGIKVNTTDLLSIEQEMMSILLNPERSFSLGPEPDTGIVLLINNQGLSEEQIFLLIMDISTCLKNLSVELMRVYVGNFIPLKGKGFTITFANNWDGYLTKYLDSPTLCNLWPPHLSSENIYTFFPARKKDVTQGCKISPLYTQLTNDVLLDLAGGLNLFTEEFAEIAKEQAEHLNYFASRYLTSLGEKQESSHPFQLFVAIGENLEALPGFGKALALLFYSGAQEFNDSSKMFVNWRMFCEAFYRGAQSLAGYSRHVPGDRSLSDFLLPLAKELYFLEGGQTPMTVIREKLYQMEPIKQLNGKNPGIQLCFYIFETLIRSLTDYIGLSTDEWSVEENNIIVSLCGAENKKIHDFCIEPISSSEREKILEMHSEMILSKPK